MQNNVTVVSQSKDEERDRKLWKIAALAAIGVGANLLAAKSLATYLANPVPDLLLVLGGAGLVAAVVFVLQALFIKSSGLLRAVLLAETLAPLFLFAEHLFPIPSLVLLAAWALFFWFVERGSVRALHRAASSISIRFFDAAHAVIPKVMTGGLLFMTAIAYLTYFSWGTLGDVAGKKFMNQLLDASTPAFRLFFSRASADQRVGEFFEAVVRAQLEEGNERALGRFAAGENLSAERAGEMLAAFRDLPPPAREAVVMRLAEQLRASLESATGPLDPDESVRDAVYRIIKARAAALAPAQHAALAAGAAILVFLALKGFLSLFHWAVALAAYLAFKLLMAFGFARIGVATQTREFVVLS